MSREKSREGIPEREIKTEESGLEGFETEEDMEKKFEIKKDIKDVLEGYKDLWRKYFERQKELEQQRTESMTDFYERKRDETEIALKEAQNMLGLSDKEVDKIKEEVREEKIKEEE
jgi:hypothetical protein